ncbi:MAG: tail fiber domain-containing protein [bacterium]
MIKKHRFAQILSGVLITSSLSTYAADVEINLNSATDALTVDQPTGTELMRVNGDGNVGIGTATPTSLLEIIGEGSSNNGLLKASDSTDTDEIMLDPNFGVTQNRTNAYFNNALVGGNISLRVSDTAARDTVALTATSDGNVGIGTTTPSQRLEVNGNIKLMTHLMSDSEMRLNPNGGTSDGFKLTGSPSTSTLVAHRNELVLGTERDTNASHDDVIFRYTDSDRTFDWMRLDATSQNIGIGIASPTETLHVVGNILATGTVTPSDERLKKDIKPVENALAKVMQLQGVTYKWKNPDSLKADTDTQLGLIAQQVEKVIPEVVETANDAQGSKSVSYASLVALLIESTKALKHENEALKTRLDALEQAQK